VCLKRVLCLNTIYNLNDAYVLRFVRARQKPLFILSWPPTVEPIQKSFPYLVTIVTGWRKGKTTTGGVQNINVACEALLITVEAVQE